MIRRYRVAHVCERLYYVEEWRFVRRWRGHRCSAHWCKWNSPVAEVSSRRMATRIAKLLNVRQTFPQTFRNWGVR